jgi:hypothetical protein
MPTPATIREPERTIAVRKEVDVLVDRRRPVGLDRRPRRSPRTACGSPCIESRSFVGGNMTIGLPVLGFLSQKGRADHRPACRSG